MSTPVPPPPSPSTSLIEAPESPQDEPIIHPSLQKYISAALTDSHTNYARFFSALLIPQDGHPQFFLDLAQFREQPTIIYLLHPGTSDNYREISRNFVDSRFAHPRCRVQSDYGKGWPRPGRAKKTSTKEREKKEQERLHRLLVPIWIAMRRRMFPGDEIVRQWNEEQERMAAERAEAKKAAAKSKPEPLDPASEVTPEHYPELGFAIGLQKAPPTSAPSSEPPDPGAVAAASKLFLGVAVTGFIMSDKRIKKYVQKKLLKK